MEQARPGGLELRVVPWFNDTLHVSGDHHFGPGDDGHDLLVGGAEPQHLYGGAATT